MNAGFDQNETELGVFVFSIALEVFAYGDGLSDSTVRTCLSLPDILSRPVAASPRGDVTFIVAG